jgi:hypothetical protein
MPAYLRVENAVRYRWLALDQPRRSAAPSAAHIGARTAP